VAYIKRLLLGFSVIDFDVPRDMPACMVRKRSIKKFAMSVPINSEGLAILVP
jgi:hypothetical protein